MVVLPFFWVVRALASDGGFFVVSLVSPLLWITKLYAVQALARRSCCFPPFFPRGLGFCRSATPAHPSPSHVGVSPQDRRYLSRSCLDPRGLMYPGLHPRNPQDPRDCFWLSRLPSCLSLNSIGWSEVPLLCELLTAFPCRS